MTPPEQAALLLQQNKPAEALMLCRQALDANPRDLRTRYFMADLGLRLGSLALTISTLVEGLELAPEDARLRRGLVNVLNGRAFNPTEMPQKLESWLMRGLEERWPQAEALVPQAFAMIHLRHRLEEGGLSDDQAHALMEDPLFRAVIGIGFFGVFHLEEVVRDLRRRALTERPDIGFLTPLAIGCYTSQYLLGVTPEEEALVAKLATDDTTDLCLIACYKPLHDLSSVDAPLPRILIQTQIAEPLVEREVAASLPALNNEAAQDDQEKGLFPRWKVDPFTLAVEPAGLREEIQYQTGIVVANPAFDDKAPELLEANCGTGQDLVRLAASMPQAEITAVDESRANLAYAKSRTDPLWGDRIDYWQGGLDDLGTKDWRFDVIHCSRTKNPAEDWKALAHVLRPGGHMSIAVHSQAALAPIMAARAFVAEQKIVDIRQARQAIAALPPDHPAKAIIMERGFYYLGEARDLLFGRQTHTTSLPEIGAALERAGLVFTGMKFPNTQVGRDLVKRFGPSLSKAQTLANWEIMESENPDLFGGMVQFWCRREG